MSLEELHTILDYIIFTETFPIDDVIPEDKKDDSDAAMNTRLTPKNFDDAFIDKLNSLVQKLK